jgi:hypothetical protein
MSEAEIKPDYEEVFTVTEYYDGSRQGVANFQGQPHFYDCIFGDKRSDYSNLYRLTPVSLHIFDLAKEDWAIWEGGSQPSTRVRQHVKRIQPYLRKEHVTRKFGRF